MSPQPAPPGYWMDETGGLLAPAVRRYLHGFPLSGRDLFLIGVYLQQWINSPVWDSNPHIDAEGKAELLRLRVAAVSIKTRDDIDGWIAHAIDCGMDPL